ncbi:dienelactone hydrolase family protein [Planomonospora sp. ID82291]|uniref:dienelactone hydrolase family protein n=1 Tax=Planomonospora sp. ID82291 TaxID=2738136 RepID=UPI0018C38673|nr:dienelactone hydrolase family protein [Planomonospora sp. ID82291]MBG0814544.1 dienelactone hydrolase family protein [Planomonospora sp. ID82291]
MEARTETVTVADGSFDLHLWLPAGGSGPAVLLVQEIFGVGPYIRRVAEDLAALGYVVGAPDLFWRIEPHWEADHTEAGTLASMEVASRLDFTHAVSDAAMALARLRSLPETTGRSGALGFCLGGSIAYVLAASVETDALLSFYGSGVPDGIGLMEKISCPALLVFGGADPYIPRDQVAKVEKAAAVRPNVEVYVAEEAGHAFHNHEAPQFHHPEAARAAWAHAAAFLRSHLPPT